MPATSAASYGWAIRPTRRSGRTARESEWRENMATAVRVTLPKVAAVRLQRQPRRRHGVPARIPRARRGQCAVSVASAARSLAAPPRSGRAPAPTASPLPRSGPERPIGGAPRRFRPRCRPHGSPPAPRSGPAPVQGGGMPPYPRRRSWAGFKAAAIAACEHSPAQHVARVPAPPALASIFPPQTGPGPRHRFPARFHSPPAASIQRSGGHRKTESRITRCPASPVPHRRDTGSPCRQIRPRARQPAIGGGIRGSWHGDPDHRRPTLTARGRVNRRSRSRSRRSARAQGAHSPSGVRAQLRLHSSHRSVLTWRVRAGRSL